MRQRDTLHGQVDGAVAENVLVMARTEMEEILHPDQAHTQCNCTG